jgi:ferredoxin
MVTVMLKDDNLRIRVPVGMTMREAALRSGASMPFGCRVGECSTCLARVEAGMPFLNEKSDKEMRVFSMLGGDVAHLRLMCQSTVVCEEGEVVISYGA